MLRFLASRLIQSIFVLWIIYTVTFFLLMLAPGDPFHHWRQAPAGDRPQGPRGKVWAGLSGGRQKFQRAEPLRTLWLHGQGVPSAISNAPALGTWARASVSKIFRSSTSSAPPCRYPSRWGRRHCLIALWLGVAAGTLGALTRNRGPDHLLSLISLGGVSLPTFVVGSLLIMFFVVIVSVFPSGGWGPSPGQAGIGLLTSSLARLVLPAATLAVFYLAYIARLSRASTLDVLSADFVRTARAKGLPESRVIIRHVGANAALPVLSYLGPAAASILVGSFVVEKIFIIPGLGTHFINGCLEKDVPLVLGEALVYSALIILFNLLVDLAYAAVDPRITLS